MSMTGLLVDFGYLTWFFDRRDTHSKYLNLYSGSDLHIYSIPPQLQCTKYLECTVIPTRLILLTSSPLGLLHGIVYLRSWTVARGSRRSSQSQARCTYCLPCSFVSAFLSQNIISSSATECKDGAWPAR